MFPYGTTVDYATIMSSDDLSVHMYKRAGTWHSSVDMFWPRSVSLGLRNTWQLTPLLIPPASAVSARRVQKSFPCSHFAATNPRPSGHRLSCCEHGFISTADRHSGPYPGRDPDSGVGNAVKHAAGSTTRRHSRRLQPVRLRPQEPHLRLCHSGKLE